jgi:DNA helicase II / ATP-dependent DNA helicase PcrA
MTNGQQNPAEIAAAKAQAKVQACVKAGRNFRLEAGAGAGKTYSLAKSLKYLVSTRGNSLLRSGQRVACITYTNGAKDEIRQEIELHPAIVVDTIHAFSWGFMAQFQSSLRFLVGAMPEHEEKLLEGGGVGQKRIDYDLGFFGVEADKITLSHDDIPRLMARLLDQEKFRRILMQTYPVIFIDEYQDTDKHFAAALSEHFFKGAQYPLIGLFGDHWQTIYRSDFSLADFPVEGINKGANFRSAPAVVNVLNALRPELPQQVRDPDADGEARLFHTNDYLGERTNSAHSKGDLPPDLARQALARMRVQLEAEGWDFSPRVTRILLLTHNALAAEQGYPDIASVFDRKEAFAKKEDKLIEFFADTLEPMCRAYTNPR